MASEPANGGGLCGKTFGSYRVGELLGSGSSGAVYSAEPTGGGSKLALRVFHADLSRDKTVAARLVSELQKASAVQHPCLVPTREVGTADYKGKRHLYVAMELLEGESLKARLGRLAEKRQGLPLGKALQIASAVGAALQAIHRSGSTHRQLVSSAVFLARPVAASPAGDEQVYLLDLGTALVPASDGGQPAAKSGKGGKVQDDIRALAQLVAEMLGGTAPGAGGGSQAVLPLHFQSSQLPARVDAVLRSALGESLGNGEGSSRYESVAALIAALQGTPDTLPTIGLWSEDGRTPPRPSPAGGSSNLLWAALFAGVVGALVSYWLYANSPSPLPPTPAPTQPLPAVATPLPVPVVTSLAPPAAAPTPSKPAANADGGTPSGHTGPWAPRLGKIPQLRDADPLLAPPSASATATGPVPTATRVPVAAPAAAAAPGAPNVPVAPSPVPTAKPPEPRSVPGAASPVPGPAPAGQKEVK